MILYRGKLYPDAMQGKLIGRLEGDLLDTLTSSPRLNAERVIAACDRMYRRAKEGKYDSLARPLLASFGISYARYADMVRAFSAEVLRYKCEIELGKDHTALPPLASGTRRSYVPLGVLLHVAAGNVDGLPAYSVAEGLLAGNINILKLPSGDSGLSVKLLSDLIEEDALLADYLYVFDVPSTETETLRRLAHLADGVVVWGGDAAQRAARDLADINTKIIPWGHKLSFAYATPAATDGQLRTLARHIAATEQLLCSSCQGIFYDGEDMGEVLSFGERFFGILQEESAARGPADPAMRGRNTVNLLCDRLEGNAERIFSGGGVSVVVKREPRLELSYTFRNIWVKPLSRHEIVRALKGQRGYLQTCGLLCGEGEREELAEMLLRAGIVRVTGGDLSRTFFGEAHDGTYPLREYMRIAEVDEG